MPQSDSEDDGIEDPEFDMEDEQEAEGDIDDDTAGVLDDMTEEGDDVGAFPTAPRMIPRPTYNPSQGLRRG